MAFLLLIALPGPDIDGLIRKLDSEQAETREASTRALLKLGTQVEAALEEALERARSTEVRARLRAILDRIDGGGEPVDGLKL